MSETGAEWPSLVGLFERLVDQGELPAEERAEKLRQAEQVAASDGEPWYVRGLAFGGAWLSAAFVAVIVGTGAALLGVPTEFLDHWIPWVLAGAVLLGGAWYLDEWLEPSLFFSHVTGVAAVAGFGSLVAGAVFFGTDVFGDEPWLWLALLAAGCLLVAVWCHARRGTRDPYAQLAFFASATGQFLAVLAANTMRHDVLVASWEYTVATAFVVELLIVAWLYHRYDSPLHRFATSLVVAGLAVATVLELEYLEVWGAGVASALAVVFALQTAIVVAAFTPDRRMPLSGQLAIRPMGYACALMIGGMASEVFLVEAAGLDSLWAYRGILAAGAVYLVYAAVEASESAELEPAVLGGAAAVVLAVVSTPGVLVGLLFVFLGLWRQEAPLLGLGFAALVYHVTVFYHLMELSFFDKSLMLMATGIVLLAVRAACVRRPWFKARAIS